MIFNFAIILALAAIATAGPTASTPDVSPTLTICTGPFPSGGCAALAITTDTCVDFTGGKSAFNKALTGLSVPNGFICTLFADFGCNDGIDPNTVVTITGGVVNLASQAAPNGFGTLINFNDMASSYSCGLLD